MVFFGRPAEDRRAPDHLYVLDLQSGEARRIAPGLTVTMPNWLFPLAVGGRSRLMAIRGNAPPEPFLDTPEPTAAPFARLGSDRVLFVLGSDSSAVVAVASIATRRILHRLPGIPTRQLQSIVGSPDGSTVYWTSGGVLWSAGSDGSDPHAIGAGDGVAVDPGGAFLVTLRNEQGRARLVRIPVEGGTEQEIAIRSDHRVFMQRLQPHSVGPDGRILLRVASPASWFQPAGILDPETGAFEPIMGAFDQDATAAAWDGEGRIITVANRIESTLWRFRPVRK